MRPDSLSTATNPGLGPGLLACLLVNALVLQACKDEVSSSSQAATFPSFTQETVDRAGPGGPWGKAMGDIDGDGLPDLVVGGHRDQSPPLVRRILSRIGIGKGAEASKDYIGELAWYRNPIWEKRIITTAFAIRTDLEVLDLDGDGRNDLLLLTDEGLVALMQPDWKPRYIDGRKLHDVEAADFDGDGDLDLAARNQSRFRYGNGDRLIVFRQDAPDRWTSIEMECPHGEGMKVVDMDGDGRPDIVVNQRWYGNPGRIDKDLPWPSHLYTVTYTWQDVFIDAGDFNGDGRDDLVVSPAEGTGQRYRISWFEAPARAQPDTLWKEHVVDPDVEAVHHFAAARDLDGDGVVDIVTAEMDQGADPDEIKAYYNGARGGEWRKEVLGNSGSHNMIAADIDGDADVDLFGANWDDGDDGKEGGGAAVTLWRNMGKPGGWMRHVLDADRPGKAIFILAADLDGDGYRDVLSGAWWYRNPHAPGKPWVRKAFGDGADNVVAARDLDGDGDSDLVASGWRGNEDARPWAKRILTKLGLARKPAVSPGSRLVWGRNDGRGAFTILGNIERAEGDFLQGAAWAGQGGERHLILSWHRPGMGVQRIRVPVAIDKDPWTWDRLSPHSQDEEITVADLDRDGDEDIVTGTRWLRNDGADTWTPLVLHAGEEPPDRHRLADLNRDGRLDVVIGFEAIGRPGTLAWYEQGADPAAPWTEHAIGRPVGPMSLDVTDMDGDGDADLIVGEHNLQSPGSAQLLLYENISADGRRWRSRVVHIGDEHHDGAQAADIDNDGDMDILSIGWGHSRVLLYENPGGEAGRR